MKQSHKLIIYLIALLTLISSTGVFLNIHECLNNCKKELSEKTDDSCCKHSCKKENCCSNEIKYVKRDNSKDENKTQFELKIPKFSVIEHIIFWVGKSFFRFDFFAKQLANYNTFYYKSNPLSKVILYRNIRC